MKFHKSFFAKLYSLFYKFKRPSIRIIQACLSNDGNIVDIRYWLTRPDKAQGKLVIFIVDEATGEKFNLLMVTRCGVVRTKHSMYEPMGILLFYNQNNTLKRGGKVSLFFGDLCAKHISIPE